MYKFMRANRVQILKLLEHELAQRRNALDGVLVLL
jgi:hypothetical protein